MNDNLEIRESRPQDTAAIEKLYPEAFPDEDLMPLVKQLLEEGSAVTSLVALDGNVLAGHVVFTKCGIAGKTADVSLLGPLAVAPKMQRRGVGRTLVRTGLRRLEQAGTDLVCVLGDPAYYGRFGFAADHDVAPPYTLPSEWSGAWQSLALNKDAPPLSGELAVAKPWRRPELWAP